ncbi:MAG TPA: hypothetical protein VJ697_03390 [Nitrososphaeraceae archaeon]|nr:hypothetical protein [Nitrososphaeraceae archaeon]
MQSFKFQNQIQGYKLELEGAKESINENKKFMKINEDKDVNLKRYL